MAGADNPEAWLRTVVVNLVRRRWRRRAMLDKILRRQRPEPAPDPSPCEHLDLHAAIQGLGPEFRSVVVLHYLADLPVDEVASVLDIPMGTVKSRLSRARATLAQQLHPEVDDV